MRNQKGFTLIELVVVIVILGILAAVAVPKFIDLSADARLANAQAIAGSLASASALNYAKALVKGAVYGAASGSGDAAVQDTLTTGCSDAVANNLIDEGAVFGGAAGEYSITGVVIPATIGAKDTCTIVSNDDATATASFTLLGAQ